jgi:hypothetical protein
MYTVHQTRRQKWYDDTVANALTSGPDPRGPGAIRVRGHTFTRYDNPNFKGTGIKVELNSGSTVEESGRTFGFNVEAVDTNGKKDTWEFQMDSCKIKTVGCAKTKSCNIATECGPKAQEYWIQVFTDAIQIGSEKVQHKTQTIGSTMAHQLYHTDGRALDNEAGAKCSETGPDSPCKESGVSGGPKKKCLSKILVEVGCAETGDGVHSEKFESTDEVDPGLYQIEPGFKEGNTFFSKSMVGITIQDECKIPNDTPKKQLKDFQDDLELLMQPNDEARKAAKARLKKAESDHAGATSAHAKAKRHLALSINKEEGQSVTKSTADVAKALTLKDNAEKTLILAKAELACSEKPTSADRLDCMIIGSTDCNDSPMLKITARRPLIAKLPNMARSKREAATSMASSSDTVLYFGVVKIGNDGSGIQKGVDTAAKSFGSFTSSGWFEPGIIFRKKHFSQAEDTQW